PSITPVASGLPTLSVDESFLTAATNGIDGSTPSLADTTSVASFAAKFTLTQGADGATVKYTLIATEGATTNLVDAQNGDPVTLHIVSTTEVQGVDAHGHTVFDLKVDTNSGQVTLTQDRAVLEGTGENPDQSETITLSSGLVSLQATATDADNDTSTASIDVGAQVSFADDGPSITPVASGLPTLSVDESFLTAATNGIDGSTPSLA